MSERTGIITLTLLKDDYYRMIEALEEQALRDESHTDYELLNLVEKIKANKQYNDMKDRARGY